MSDLKPELVKLVPSTADEFQRAARIVEEKCTGKIAGDNRDVHTGLCEQRDGTVMDQGRWHTSVSTSTGDVYHLMKNKKSGKFDLVFSKGGQVYRSLDSFGLSNVRKMIVVDAEMDGTEEVYIKADKNGKEAFYKLDVAPAWTSFAGSKFMIKSDGKELGFAARYINGKYTLEVEKDGESYALFDRDEVWTINNRASDVCSVIQRSLAECVTSSKAEDDKQITQACREASTLVGNASRRFLEKEGKYNFDHVEHTLKYEGHKIGIISDVNKTMLKYNFDKTRDGGEDIISFIVTSPGGLMPDVYILNQVGQLAEENLDCIKEMRAGVNCVRYVKTDIPDDVRKLLVSAVSAELKKGEIEADDRTSLVKVLEALTRVKDIKSPALSRLYSMISG